MENVLARMNCRALRGKVMSPEEASRLIADGDTLAVSGFTPSGSPKAVTKALADAVKEGRRPSFTAGITLLSGASTGPEVDDALGGLGIIRRRFPYITSRTLRDAVNGGMPDINYMDQHLGMMAQNARYGFYGHIDAAIIEAEEILPDGGIIPGTGLGCAQTYIDLADKVIIEVNPLLPAELNGIHDIVSVQDPPGRRAIPIFSPGDRIGRPFLACPPEKIAAIVIEESPEHPRPLAAPDETSRRIAGHIVDFFKKEAVAGRISPGTSPLQSGVGSVANAVLNGLTVSDFNNLTFYSEVIQDGVLDLMDAGRAVFASGSSLSLSSEGMERFIADIGFYRDRIVLRDSEISNNPEVIRRLGVIAMNTAIEADIYGNVNSSHIDGTKIFNGIGGSGDYARNSAVSIFMTGSVTKGGRVSCIVPMAAHVDHPSQDVDVIVTEQGFADLRGRSPRERARLIIENCAHPDYRPLLEEYFVSASAACGNSQTPHLLDRCFSFHLRYKEKGSMLE